MGGIGGDRGDKGGKEEGQLLLGGCVYNRGIGVIGEGAGVPL
jgi:hypothetical protein